MMTSIDFVQKFKLKNKTASNIKKNQQIISSLSLNDVRIYLRDGPSSDIGIVNLHPSKGTHWVAYINKNFDSFGCAPPNKLSKYF